MFKQLSISIFFTLNFIFSQMIQPINGDNLNYIHILFEWEQINNADSYNFQLNDNSNFNNPEISLNTNSLAYIEKDFIEWDSSYFWRVQPVFNNGSVGEWLNAYNFSTGSTRSNATAIMYNPESYNDGLTLFSSFFNYFSAMIDKDGNEIWNTGNNNIVYYNTDYFGEYFGCYVDNSLEHNLPGIQFSTDNQTLWSEPNNHFLHHELIEIDEQYYIGIIETEQLGPIPNGEWTPTFQFLGYQADGVTNEFPWVGDKIVIWDKDTNQIVWEWDSFEHFSMLDYDDIAVWELALNIGRFDWTHANALATTDDENGNLKSIYLSSRHLSRITKIDYPSGNVVWNMGLDMDSGDVHCGHDIKFSWQHSLMVEEIDNISNITLLDNGNLSQVLLNNINPTSRGLEISVTNNGTFANPSCEANVIWEHELPGELFGYASGNVQKLDNGNYLIVTIGDAGTALEVNSSNEEIWKGNFALQQPNGAVYRANRVSGLYPISYSLTIPGLNKNENLYFFNNQQENIIPLHIQNIGTSHLKYRVETYFDGGDLYFSDSSIIPTSSSNINPEEWIINLEIPNSDYITIIFIPTERPDLKKEFTIFFDDNDCDYDGDGICDNVDICPYDNLNDQDNDGICGNDDDCPFDTNNDSDGDGSCDSEDICVGDDNSGDLDSDGTCDNVDICPNDFFNDYDNDGLCDSDDPCPDDENNNCGNQNPCEDNYTYLNNIPNGTVILDFPNNCFNNNDLSVLNDIIVINNLNIEFPIYLGTQNWNNGRLKYLEIGNHYQGGNIIIDELPSSIGDLNEVGILDLQENNLTSLPDNITQLSNLVYLDLHFNQLVSIPNNIGNMINISWLDLGYNEIEYLPNSIVNLENLDYLWIYNNNLSELPENFCNLNMDWNSLNYNFLPYFASGGNQLCEDLPECVANSSNINSSIDPLYYSFVIQDEQNCGCDIMDVNTDGLINVVDIVNTVNIIFNQLEPTDIQLCAADANEDGTINVVDIVNIVNYIFEN